MTIREFRDKYQPTMDQAVLAAGEYLEHSGGLIFGHDFVTGDVLNLASAWMTRKITEDTKDELNAAIVARQAAEALSGVSRANRFEDEDWSTRFGRDETYDV